MPLDIEKAKSLLPSKPTASLKKPSRLKYLAMAEPKWGKTTLFCGVPNALLLAFEEGHAFIEANKIIIDRWDVALKVRTQGGSWATDDDGNTHCSAYEALEALEAYCPYEFIIIDTVDMASKMCTDYECEKAGVGHPSDGGEFGKGWAMLQTDPFRRWFGRIVKLGVGIGCTTHIAMREDSKTKQVRRESTLPSGIQKFIHTQADVIINGYFGRRRKGEDDRDRVISFDGSNDVLAGSRVRGVHLPKKYIVTPPSHDDHSLPWKQWTKFFEDPKAAQEAEDQYARLIRGKDDEVLEARDESAKEEPPVATLQPEPANNKADKKAK